MLDFGKLYHGCFCENGFWLFKLSDSMQFLERNYSVVRVVMHCTLCRRNAVTVQYRSGMNKVRTGSPHPDPLPEGEGENGAR